MWYGNNCRLVATLSRQVSLAGMLWVLSDWESQLWISFYLVLHWWCFWLSYNGVKWVTDSWAECPPKVAEKWPKPNRKGSFSNPTILSGDKLAVKLLGIVFSRSEVLFLHHLHQLGPVDGRWWILCGFTNIQQLQWPTGEWLTTKLTLPANPKQHFSAPEKLMGLEDDPASLKGAIWTYVQGGELLVLGSVSWISQ